MNGDIEVKPRVDEALAIAARLGYPLMVRPSYVLGGRGMEVVHDEEMLRRYMAAAVDVTPERPILIDKFLVNAIEAGVTDTPALRKIPGHEVMLETALRRNPAGRLRPGMYVNVLVGLGESRPVTSCPSVSRVRRASLVKPSKYRRSRNFFKQYSKCSLLVFERQKSR